jgi:O-antigen ligase
MILNRPIYYYFLFLFSIIPLTILIGSSISLLNIIILDISFIILVIYEKNFFFLKKKSIKYLLILYIYLIFNSFISIDFFEGIYRNFGFLRIIILFAAFNYFFLDNSFFKRVFRFWIITILIVMIDVFIESLYGRNILGFGEPYGERIVSFFKDEPIVGGYLNGFYLIIIGFLLNELKDNQNYLTIILSIIFIISILLTGERSNSIKAFLGISIFFVFYKNLEIKKKMIILFSMIILVFILLFSSSFLKLRFIYQINSLIKKDNIYFQLYESGFEVFKNNKLIGVGNKNYRVETCREINKNDKYFCSTHPHQIYFELLSEHGIIGTLIFFFILYKIVFSKIRNTLFENNYLKLGSLIYMMLIFIPILPGGAFFNSYMLTIFTINLSILYASDKQLNIFNKID